MEARSGLQSQPQLHSEVKASWYYMRFYTTMTQNSRRWGGGQIIKIHIFVQSLSLQYSSSPPHHCEVSGASLDKTLIIRLQVACSTKIPPLPGSINLSFPVPLDTLCQPRYFHDSAQSLTTALLVSHTWIINLSNQILLKSPLPLVCYLSHKGCTNTMSSACTLGQYTPQALLLLSGFSP